MMPHRAQVSLYGCQWLGRAPGWCLRRVGFTPLVLHTFFTIRQSTLARLRREQPGGWFDQPWPQVIAAAREPDRTYLAPGPSCGSLSGEVSC
jgi:hypothetical protein